MRLSCGQPPSESEQGLGIRHLKVGRWQTQTGDLDSSCVYFQGGVTPIDSIVTAATAVGQWSTVKAAQTGAVNGQSGSKVQSKTRAALFMATYVRAGKYYKG